MIEKSKLENAYRYANLLNTAAERRYASAYIGWMRNGATGLTPSRGRIAVAAAEQISTSINSMNLWGISNA